MGSKLMWDNKTWKKKKKKSFYNTMFAKFYMLKSPHKAQKDKLKNALNKTC
jgi:hypothetical protein